MNDQTLQQLKILVERAVRPVATSATRKIRMREELLLHVTAAFEQEMARLGDESAALAQTAQRFGNPDELTAQLQQAASPPERIRAFIDQIWSRPGQRLLIRAVRQGALIELLMLGFLLLPWLLAGAPTKQFRGDFWSQIGPQLLAISLCAGSFPFLALWMQKALYHVGGRSYANIILLTATCGLIFLTFSIWLDGLTVLGQLLAMAYGAIWMPVSLGCIARVAADRVRQEREWTVLEI